MTKPPTTSTTLVLAALAIAACSSSNSAGADSRADSGSGGSAATTADAGSGGAGPDAGAAGGGVGAGGASPDAGATVTPPTVPTAVPLAMLPAVFAKVVCFQYLQCCTADERACGQLPDQPGACEPAANTAEMALVARATKSIAAGRTRYDGAVMAACLAKVANDVCSDARKAPAFASTFCNAFTPMVAKGGACQDDFECVGGFCSDATPDKDGTCMPLKPDGSACILNDECMSGYCSEVDANCGPGPGVLCF